MMRKKTDGVSDTSSYRQAFDRIRAEYLEMPGMRLTVEQVHRLSGVDIEICTAVLEDLVRAKFLQAGADRTYLRATAQSSVRSLADSSLPRGASKNASR
jgi:hypothetical protein